MTCTARTRSSLMRGIYSCHPKAATPSARPSMAGAFNRDGWAASAIGALPRDPRDVRPGDPDVGQFAVAELGKLVQAGVVAPPGLQEVQDCDEHGWLPLIDPARGRADELPHRWGSMVRRSRRYVALQSCIECMA